MLSFYHKSNISITIRDTYTLPCCPYYSEHYKPRPVRRITITFGSNCSEEWQEKLFRLFKNISTPLVIEEDITRVSSDIASCGPAFFSYLLQCFINAAVDKTNITHEEATTLVSEMVVGMGKLLDKGIFTLPTLQEKVCVKGGVTGEGIRVLEEHVGDMFHKLIERTHEKFDEDLKCVDQQFNKHT